MGEVGEGELLIQPLCIRSGGAFLVSYRRGAPVIIDSCESGWCREQWALTKEKAR